MRMLVTQSCPTLFDTMDSSPPGSSVHGILQARILEWIAVLESQGDLPDPGIELESPSCGQILYHLSLLLITNCTYIGLRGEYS